MIKLVAEKNYSDYRLQQKRLIKLIIVKMRTKRAVIILLIITGLSYCYANSCALPASSQTIIKSDEINIQSTTNIASIAEVASAPTYSYNYKNDMGVTPTTAYGINGFDFDPSTVAGIQISIVNLQASSLGFKIALNSNANWKTLKINFLSTNRPDLEIGSLDFVGPTKGDSFPLTYPFKNKWKDANFLRYRVFISGFNFKTNEKSIIKINLQRTQVSATSINLLYSTKQSSTIINSFSINLIIFDGYNPAFRFVEGVITQSYLSAKMTLQIPQQGVSQMRTFLTGLTSFEVSSNVAISIYSNMASNFSMQIGPNSNNCQINLVSISYIILSVYPDCGACGANNILFNGKCVDQCPDGYFVKAGKCQPRVCQSGFYLIGNNCIKCPKHSNIKQCNNACPQGTKLYGQDCISVCVFPYQIYSYGNCVCQSGYYRIGRDCDTCPIGTKYDYSLKQCVSVCPSNSVFVVADSSCRCNKGYNMLHGQCIKCPEGNVFDLTWGCHMDCKSNQVFNGYECTCQTPLVLIGKQCGSCAQNQIYDAKNKNCKPRCSTYEIWQANNCACIPGYYRIKGQCKKCGQGQTYEPSIQNCRNNCVNGQIWSNGKCQCLPGSYWVNNNCQICPVQTKYDPKTQNCQKICKKQYQYFNNGKCLCLRSYERNSNQDCVPKKCPDNSNYNAGSDTCVCNNGYYLSLFSGLCQKIPDCPKNSKWSNLVCTCNNGYNWNQDKTACIKCDMKAFEVFNGVTCVCADGYVRNNKDKCVKIVIPPTCGKYEVYNPTIKACVCVPGCQRINGVCIQIQNCAVNSYWNGVNCVCSPGYVINIQTGKCDKIIIPPPIPNCPYNSKFNGVKCVCNERFFQFEPGLCATCPPNMTWNGRKCAYDKNCWQGYAWDNATQCCVAIGNGCPKNSIWNGQACQCNPGFNAANGQCIRCQAGFQFDGSSCVRVPDPVVCIGLNRIAVGNQCVCAPGSNLYGNICVICTYPTVWNGRYCQGNSDSCLTVPYSQIDITTRRCKCIKGYRGVQGTCVPIPGYLRTDAGTYSWTDGYRWVGYYPNANNVNTWNKNNNWGWAVGDEIHQGIVDAWESYGYDSDIGNQQVKDSSRQYNGNQWTYQSGFNPQGQQTFSQNDQSWPINNNQNQQGINSFEYNPANQLHGTPSP